MSFLPRCACRRKETILTSLSLMGNKTKLRLREDTSGSFTISLALGSSLKTLIIFFYTFQSLYDPVLLSWLQFYLKKCEISWLFSLCGSPTLSTTAVGILTSSVCERGERVVGTYLQYSQRSNTGLLHINLIMLCYESRY